MKDPIPFQVVADIHGSQIDERASEACLAFTESFKPSIRVIAGDLWDFGAIRKGASADEQAQGMAEDYEDGVIFANRFFKGGKENHLMMGNHDVRAFDLSQSCDGVKGDLGQRMVLDIEALARKNKAKLWPYDSRLGVLEIGKLKVVHGYHTGMSACATHSRIYGNVIFGHVHSIESFQTPGLQQQEARAIGCLCKLDMDYVNRKTGKLRWAHGWAAGYLFEDGTYTLWQIRGINGKFYAPTGLERF
jgi:predicted phosphodiesterase